uniref:Uncharacterized protein n=1 Tax=Xenopus tropicalis TaxID=8364 RepID=A0A1B8XUX3_XENTR
MAPPTCDSPHVTDCSLEQSLPPCGCGWGPVGLGTFPFTPGGIFGLGGWGGRPFRLSDLHHLDTNPLARVALGDICLQPKGGIKGDAVADGARGHVGVDEVQERLDPVFAKNIVKYPANGAGDAVGAVPPQPLQAPLTEGVEANGQDPGLHWPKGSVVVQAHRAAQNIGRCPLTLGLLGHGVGGRNQEGRPLGPPLGPPEEPEKVY